MSEQQVIKFKWDNTFQRDKWNRIKKVLKEDKNAKAFKRLVEEINLGDLN